MSAAITEARKWTATARIAWSGHLAYKLNFVLLVIGPALVFFFIKLNLWRSIYGDDATRVIQGYDLGSMIRYQGWVMVVAFLAQSFQSMSLAEDIRMGRISSYLIYPFSFWKFHAASFLAFQSIQLVVASVTLSLLVGFELLPMPSLSTLATGFVYCSLVSIFWFAICFVLGLASLWMEETWVLRVMFLIVCQFLSGGIVPLEIFPAQMMRILEYLPFPYMTFVPVRIMMGEYTGSVGSAFLTLAVWLIVLSMTASAMWRRGLRLYTAAGM